jgi:hypothetical protein
VAIKPLMDHKDLKKQERNGGLFWEKNHAFKS